MFFFSLEANAKVRHTTISCAVVGPCATTRPWAAILSQVGGLAFTALGIVYTLFASSGFVNARGDEMLIFKCLPEGSRARFLKDAPPTSLAAIRKFEEGRAKGDAEAGLEMIASARA